MKIIVAKTAGFCFGVKRAVKAVYEEAEKAKGNKIYTFGPIIHNQEVINDLKNHGVEVIETENTLEEIEEDVIIIRSHGISKRLYDNIIKKTGCCVDATCPFVKKIHRIVEEQSKSGVHIVVIGDKYHPEVEGIMGWAIGEITVLQTEKEAREFYLSDDCKVCIVAQTTFNYNKFKDLVEIISEKGYDISVLNTICNATKERQEEALAIAMVVDAMIVIGDKHSSNTQKLFEICKKACNNTYYIQTLDDLDMNQLRSVDTVGITAGASTPNNIIEEVQSHVRINF